MKAQITDLREIAEENGLKYIETTSERNGYPSAIRGAIIGFDGFEKAEEIAEKYGLEIELFTKNDGWQLWYRTGNTAYEPLKNTSDDYGDNYTELHKMSEEEYIEKEVALYITDGHNTLNGIQEFLNVHKEIYNEIESMEDDEIVILRNGQYYDTVKKESMYFSHDTKHYAIGVINEIN